MGDRGLRSSVLRRVRHRAGPAINRLVRVIGQPTIQVHPPGYVGTVELAIGDFEAELQDGGFSWDPLSMYHYTPEGNSTDGSWAYRPSLLADRQLHAVLFAQDGDRTDVYVHEEFSWLRHPIKHAKQVDIRRDEGVAEMRRWLDERDLPYHQDTFLHRRLRHAVERVRDRVRRRFGDRTPHTLRQG